MTDLYVVEVRGRRSGRRPTDPYYWHANGYSEETHSASTQDITMADRMSKARAEILAEEARTEGHLATVLAAPIADPRVDTARIVRTLRAIQPGDLKAFHRVASAAMADEEEAMARIEAFVAAALAGSGR